MTAQVSEFSARLIDLFGNPLTADPTKLYGNLTLNPNGTVGIGTGLIMPDGFTSSLTPSGRNKIINGDCKVQQRPSLVMSSGATGTYGGPDRFCTGMASGAGGQYTQSAGTITYGGVARQAVVQTVNTVNTSVTGSNYWLGIQQRIEGYNAFDLMGQPVVVSFLFNTNVTGTYSVSLIDGTAANSCVATFSATANTPQRVFIVFPSLPVTLSIPNSTAIGMYVTIGMINTGTYQASTANSWVSGSYYTVAGSTNWGLAVNNFIALTELQVEPGLNATPFERVNFADSLLRCQRYYETGVQVYTITNSAYYQTYFKASKRNTPTVTASASVGTIASVSPAADGLYWTYNFTSNTNISLTWTSSAEL